MHIGWFSL